jgi:hypothetical protein
MGSKDVASEHLRCGTVHDALKRFIPSICFLLSIACSSLILAHHLSDGEVQTLSYFVRDERAEVVADDDVPRRSEQLLNLHLDQLGTLLPVEEITPAHTGGERREMERNAHA